MRIAALVVGLLLPLSSCSDADTDPNLIPLDAWGASTDSKISDSGGSDLSDTSQVEVSPSPDTSADLVSTDSPSVPDAQVEDAQVEDAQVEDTQVEDAKPGIPDPKELGPLSWTNAEAEVELGGGGFFPGKAELTIYLPDGPGPFPVVVFSHGFQLGPENYVSYGEHLASWGFVAVLPKFPGSLIVPRTHAQLKEDLSAILDWIEGAPGELSGKADASKIGLSGHSMGGKISLLLASSDDRAKAAFVIDPVDSGPPFALNPFDYPSVAPELMADIAIPLGILGETTSSEGGLIPCAPADENFQQYYKAATSPALQIDMIGASHMSFLDDPNCGLACSACPAGSDDPAVTRALTLRAMTAFYLTLLDGDPVMASWLTDWDNLDPATADLVDIELKNGF